MALQTFIQINEKGEPIEVRLFDLDYEELPADFVEGWQEGFYKPVYNREEGVWVESKPSAEIFAELKARKIGELKARCEATINEPFQATNGHLYEFELKDQINFSQMFSLLIAIPTYTDIQWRTLDADVVLHTREQFLKVISDAQTHKQGNINKYWQLKGLVDVATTVEELNNITWGN